MKKLCRVFVTFVITFSTLTAEAAANDVSCTEFNAQKLAAQAAYDQKMHDQILGLCHQTFFQGSKDFFATYYKNLYVNFNSVFWGNLHSVFERIGNHGLTMEADKIMQYPKLDQVIAECYPDRKFLGVNTGQLKRSTFRTNYYIANYNGAIQGLALGIMVQLLIFKGYAAAVGKFMKQPFMVFKVPLLSPVWSARVIQGSILMMPYLLLELFQWSHIGHVGDLKPVDNPKPEVKPETIQAPPNAVISDLVDRDLLNQVLTQAHFQMIEYDGVSVVPPKAVLASSQDSEGYLHEDNMKPDIDAAFNSCMKSISRYNQKYSSRELVGDELNQIIDSVIGPCRSFVEMAKSAQVYLTRPTYRCKKENIGLATEIAAAVEEMYTEIPEAALSK